ncbi:prion-inhibition and propagation-domain-containing protein [Hypoxylon trugodes]|uniref:prion-inhibition and propagation-domain-containing protein n=1 Tax=Hypoxylon trugodes TaxID=326681 RepID=UPI002197E7C0|nr:prion-inhibition and propagation-domain-containing protein [Hypoxylon trugodes]KAI1385244.1 prion-inhibition and propagation-domain-containing protein [Hypoxylon trugodes]
MDPGTALGVVSLAFQVFAGCIKGCQLLLDARDLPQNYGYMRHRLHLEQLKLLDWWNASDFAAETISEDDPLDERTQALLDSLVEIRTLTLEFGRIKGRYDLMLKIVDGRQRSSTPSITGLLTPEFLGTREILRQKALRYADIVLKCPTMLRWAMFDATKFEQLLAKLTELNNSMHFSLEFKQRCRYLQFQETTQLQFLHLFTKLDQVVELLRSLRLPPQNSLDGSQADSDDGVLKTLGQLARFKALYISVDDDNLPSEENITARIGLQISSPGSLKLSLSHLKFREDQEEQKAQRVAGTYDNALVWVEWKDYGEWNTTLAYSYVEDRVARLAALFLDNPDKPRGLRLPTAHGYVHDPVSTRFGLVFELPAIGSISVPQSLYTRLQTTMKPSLTTRLDMARKLTASLEHLHATKWLHKGLRSDNILFLTSSSSSDWMLFCLAGFDYSRPANPGALTELPSDRREHDLYRHPNVQFDVPREGEYGYREEHDVYSLGVVLMEIGLWQPIHQFLGISLNRLIPRPKVREVRKQLLKVGSLATLEAETGCRYSEAVRICLEGNPWANFTALQEDREPVRTSRSRINRAQEILQSIQM